MNNVTMIRRASELDVGSRIVVGEAVRTVVQVHDLPSNSSGAFVTLVLDNGCAIVERARTLYRCA
jgi:hypothetical protein